MSIRTRYAPSPTGDLHLGSLRTVIFEYLVAKQAGGAFIMRIEDTDQARTVAGSVEQQLQAMRWAGIVPDEGVYLEGDQRAEKGEFGPYTQSQRLDIYKEHSDKLLDSGAAYRCFCSHERLEQMREEQQQNHQPPRYDRHCRSISRDESDRRAVNEPFVIRCAIPDGKEVVFTDLIRGELNFKSDELDDYVLLKSDGFPTYQLANVVDDHLMQITHVLRGEEWIPSTPKNLLLYQAFGWEAPQYAHLPVILGPDGKHKLSKRDGDVSVLSYQQNGYLPEALFNVLAFLGWSPGTEEEFFTQEQLIERFKLEKVQKSPAVFNFERLDYVNGWYIRQLPVEKVVEYMQPFWDRAGLAQDASPEYLRKVAGAVQQRLKYFGETEEVTKFFFKRPEVNNDLRALVIPKKGDAETTHVILREVIGRLETMDEPWEGETMEAFLRGFIEEKGYKPMEVLWPIRAALTGVQASPGTFEMLVVLGKEESLERLRAAV